MRKCLVTFQMFLITIPAVGFCSRQHPDSRQIEIETSVNKVPAYGKLELLIKIEKDYDNPFDPEEVDVALLLKTPDNKQITLPAFYCQDYERRKLNQGRGRTSWYYPVGRGSWKARFAPTQTGTYSAAARLIDRTGTTQSDSIRFDCIPSSGKGFLRIGKKDPRFLEFTDGTAFFAIGQNLAFIGESQYVTLTKAEEIFARLSQNGANFLRIWTCCKDWAMAIEAGKSAWDRSWHRNATIVPIPGGENKLHPRKCVMIQGGDGASITASPSHPVALRPNTRYKLTGRFIAKGATGLRIKVGNKNWELPFDAAAEAPWKDFSREFVTGENDFWLGRIVLSLIGSGTAWLDNLSLRDPALREPKEVPDGPELLWEADVNRPKRGVYNQLDCFMLDQLLKAAEQNGIYLMLCLLTRDLYMKDLSDDRSPEYQQAINDAKKFMRYAVARWGYSTGVAAWEYFNEIDPGLPTDRFYSEVGEYLEQIDIYHHLRTTSTWHPSAKDCRHPHLDIGQLHHYMRPETKENFRDEVAVLIDKTQFLRKYAPDKPVLIGEFGLATPKWGLSEYMKQDNEGVHFHNSLWASAFAGPSGTAMFWWWDQLDKQDAYSHYRPLAAFLQDVSFAGLRPLEATTSSDRLRLLGRQGDDRAYFCLFDAQALWWNRVVDKKQPAPTEPAAIDINGLRPGSYRLEWWDTYHGKVIRTEQISLDEGPLHISVPSFTGNIACKTRQ